MNTRLLKLLLFTALAFGALSSRRAAAQTLSYTGGTLTENFDSMGPAGTNTLPGWFVGYADPFSNLRQIFPNDGSIAPNGTAAWNFGTNSGADRALGTMATSTGSAAPNDSRWFEARIRNNSGQPFTNLTVNYDGEQWRAGSANTVNTLVMQVSVDGANYANLGTAFDFTQPTFTPFSSALDGNQSTNRAPGRGGTFSLASPLPPGGTLFLRWFDANETGTDPALAIDNFSFSAASAPPPPPTVALSNPANGASFLAGDNVTVAAAAQDASGVAFVDFFDNGVLRFHDTTAPHGFTLADLAPGTHTLLAIARGNGGLNATSAPVNITVINEPTVTVLVANGSTWKYLDNGSDQGTAWRAPDFIDSGWSNGVAELGYGDDAENPPRPERTKVNGGPTTNRFITTYCRLEFTVPDPSALSNVNLRLLCDDGAVGYLNGVEVFRYNMPTGAIGYLTLANPPGMGGADEVTFFTPSSAAPGANWLPPLPGAGLRNALVPGRNVLAVEVHQVNVTSSDLSFDLTMLDQPGVTPCAQPILYVVETGGDNTAPSAKFTGQTFNHPNEQANFTVPAFGEDVSAFTDRNHEWNGAATNLTLPAYLLGGQYVMIQSDNKDNPAFRLDVTLCRPALVYLLLDNRLGDDDNNSPPTLGAVMPWVTANGWTPVRTGRNRAGSVALPDEVGIDQNGNGVGPGISVEDFSSVFVKQLPAGTFPLFEQNDGFTRSMYGVVVAATDSYTITIQPGQNLIANQLDGGANTLNEILPNVPPGSRLSKLDEATQTIHTDVFEDFDLIWLDLDTGLPSTTTLGAYEAAFLNNPGAAYQLVFSGQPRANVPPPPSLEPERRHYRSGPVNAPASYTDMTGLAPEEGALFIHWDATNQSFVTNRFTNGAWPLGEPVAAVGNGVIVSGPIGVGCLSFLGQQNFLRLRSGANNAGLLPNGTPDGQFLVSPSLFAAANPFTLANVVWNLSPGGLSRWIGPASGAGPGGVYAYTNHFWLPCTSQAALVGRYAADNSGSIWLNGIHTPGNDTVPTYGFANWKAVSITSGFQQGWNTLVFYVTNNESYTGLRVELTGTYCAGPACPPCLAITCPPNACYPQVGPGTVVNYPPPNVTTPCNTTINGVACLPPSGSTFPSGPTTVTCTAQDHLGNIASCSFAVTVALNCCENLFSDNTFNNSDWSLTVFSCPNDTSASASQRPANGCDGGSFREIINLLSPTSLSYFGVVGIHLKNGATHDPSSQGGLSTVDYSECNKLFSGGGAGHATGPALKQGGNYYIVSVAKQGATPQSTWAPFSLTGLSAADFDLVDCTQPAFRDTTQHPSFCAGPPIQFGFFRANSASGPGAGNTLIGGIDNWRVQTYCGACCVPPSSLPPMVAWWPLDEPAGTTMYQDLAGANNALIQPGPLNATGDVQASPNGKVAGASWFLLPGAHGRAPNASALNFGNGGFSVDCWFQAFGSLNSRYLAIVDKFDAGTQRGYSVGINLGQLQLRLGNGALTTYTSTLTVPSGAWVFIGVAVDRTLNQVRFQVNATVETQNLAAVGNINSTLDLLIGGYHVPPTPFTTEHILDEVEMFDSALTTAQFDLIRNAGSAGKCKPNPIPPQIQIVQDGTNIVLSWPGIVTNFNMEETTNLQGTNTVWTAVTNAPIIVGVNNQVTLPGRTPGRFFRLRGPGNPNP